MNRERTEQIEVLIAYRKAQVDTKDDPGAIGYTEGCIHRLRGGGELYGDDQLNRIREATYVLKATYKP